MIGGRSDPKPKPKSSNTAASKGKDKGRGKPINIPLDNISPELKKILVKEMVKGGRVKIVRLRDRVNQFIFCMHIFL